MDTNTVYLSLSPAIQVDANAAGDDLPTRFSGVAYSGGLIPQFGAFGDSAIDLATLQPAEKIFMLENHNPDKRAGHGRVWVEGDQIRVEGQFARSTETGRQIAAEFRDGAPWQLSVGLQYQAQRPREPVLINGQTLAVKTLFTHAAIREVSFVPVGADPNTSVAAFAAELTSTGDALLSAELEARIADLQSQLSAAQAELAAEKAAKDVLESELNTVKAAAKLAAVKALFAQLGKDFTDETASPYLALPEAALALMSAEFKTLTPKLDPALTQQVATAGATGPDVIQLNAKLMAQVAGTESK